MEEVEEFFFHIGERIHEHRARIDALLLVNDKRGNPQRSNRQPSLLVRTLGVVVDKPVDCGINWQIHLRIINRRNLRQNHGGAICLHSGSVVEFLDILNKYPHGDLLIRIVSRHVDADKRDEAHLGMCLELPDDLFARRVGGNLIEKLVHLCVPPFF